MDDSFIRDYVEDLLKKIRTQVKTMLPSFALIDADLVFCFFISFLAYFDVVCCASTVLFDSKNIF